MHIPPLCCNEMANRFLGDKMYHPTKTLVQKIDISAHKRRRERRVWILYGNQNDVNETHSEITLYCVYKL